MKKKGGRPEVPAKEKRSKKMQTHFTPGEFQEVEAKAILTGMTHSEFLRSLALDFEIKSQPKDLKKIQAELGKIGSNINQIAKKVNTGGKFDGSSFKKTTAELLKVLEKL